MSELASSTRRLSRALNTMWSDLWKMMSSYMGPDVLREVRKAVGNMIQSERELEALRGTRAALEIEQLQGLLQAAGFYANSPVERVFDALIRQGTPRAAAAVRAKAAALELPFAEKQSRK